MGAVFLQGKKASGQATSNMIHGVMKSKLYFMDKKQVSREAVLLILVFGVPISDL